MGPETGYETADLIGELQRDPKGFSYFQALRLLFRAHAGKGAPQDRASSLAFFLRNAVRVRAEVDLGFPGSDITEVKWAQPSWKGKDPFHRLTVTFMGLYGSASPLPPFYGREVLEDVLDDMGGIRGFFDLISYFSYRNHAHALFLGNIASRILEAADGFTRLMLRSFLGVPHAAMRRIIGRRDQDLPYLQLFATKLRHAPGLVTYLSGRLGGQELDLEECVPRTLDIPVGQRARLGHDSASLGETAMLGRHATDLTGKFRIVLKVSDMEGLEDFMPGGAKRKVLEEALARYVDSPLEWDVLVSLGEGSLEGFTLGSKKRPLGISTFLSPRKSDSKDILSPAMAKELLSRDPASGFRKDYGAPSANQGARA
ncbi:MAG: type VI secretion system baseplate subunit TssG [Deltaproteobacteria bacterium]|nr:type VI secretion system baseplate subunit TssG [Deltaproteobacteria bacterium]